jgi:hypothetical protein
MPIPTSCRSPVKESGGRRKAQSGGVEQIIHQDFMPSAEWDMKNRVMFPIYLIRACDFKAITGFDPPPTPVNAAAYKEHKLEFPDEYIKPGVIEDPVVDAKEEDEGKENQKPHGKENVYELSAFEDDSLEFSPRQMKSLSIRNFV